MHLFRDVDGVPSRVCRLNIEWAENNSKTERNFWITNWVLISNVNPFNTNLNISQNV